MSTESETEPARRVSNTIGNDGDTICGDSVDNTPDQGALESADLTSLVAHESRPASPGRPWVMVNMVCSVDGATAGADGRSGSLSGPADRALFAALRATADVILAGAETIRVENYGAPRLPAGAEAARLARGQAPMPRIAVVSGSLRLAPDARLFREALPDAPPILFTTTSTLRRGDHPPELDRLAEMRQAGDTRVDWRRVLQILHDDYGAGIVLVEGGPSVNGQLVVHDLIDELCVSLAPLLTGAESQRLAGGTPLRAPLTLRLDRVLEEDGFLFLRYLRQR